MNYQQRIEFWKHAYAHSALRDARMFIEELLNSSLPLGHPIRKSLSFSILTAYARPFKQRKSVRLSDGIVPEKFRELHEGAIEVRDKIVAHRDLDGPIANWGYTSPVRLLVKEKTIQVNTYSPIYPDKGAAEMLPLIDFLLEQVNPLKLLTPYASEIIFKDGNYNIDLDPSSNSWFKKI